MKWVIWAFLLVAQQLSHGLSSRAKNRDNYFYNLWAATLSNGVWICSNFVMVGSVLDVIKGGDVVLAIFTVVYYTVFCVIGSLLSQWLAINYFERRMEK